MIKNVKQFVLSALFVFFSINGFTKNTNRPSELTDQSIELLVKKQDQIKMDGNVSPGEKLRPILTDLGEFITTAFDSFFDNTADNDYLGAIKKFTANCLPLTENSKIAECQLIIQYQPLGEVGIAFVVELDQDYKPTAIQGNRVDVTRGD